MNTEISIETIFPAEHERKKKASGSYSSMKDDRRNVFVAFLATAGDGL